MSTAEQYNSPQNMRQEDTYSNHLKNQSEISEIRSIRSDMENLNETEIIQD